MREDFQLGPLLIMMKDIILLSEHVGVARVHAICLRPQQDGHLLVCSEGHILNIMDEFVQAAIDKGVPIEGIDDKPILLPMGD